MWQKTIFPSISRLFADASPLEDGNLLDIETRAFLPKGSLQLETSSAKFVAPGWISEPLMIASLNLWAFHGVTLCKSILDDMFEL